MTTYTKPSITKTAAALAGAAVTTGMMAVTASADTVNQVTTQPTNVNTQQTTPNRTQHSETQTLDVVSANTDTNSSASDSNVSANSANTNQKTSNSTDTDQVSTAVMSNTQKAKSVSADISAQQRSVNIKFIDDDANQSSQILSSKVFNGSVGSVIDYTTAKDINNFTQRHYQLVNDPTNGQPITLTNADNQLIEIHLKHQTEQVTGQWTPIPPVVFDMTPNQLNHVRTENPFDFSDPKYGVDFSALGPDGLQGYREELNYLKISWKLLQQENPDYDQLNQIDRSTFESLPWSKQNAIVSLITVLARSIASTNRINDQLIGGAASDDGFNVDSPISMYEAIYRVYPNVFAVVKQPAVTADLTHDLVTDDLYLSDGIIKLNPNFKFVYDDAKAGYQTQCAAADGSSISWISLLADTQIVNGQSFADYLFHNRTNIDPATQAYTVLPDGSIQLKQHQVNIDDHYALSKTKFGYQVGSRAKYYGVNGAFSNALNSILFGDPVLSTAITSASSVFRAAVYGEPDYRGGVYVQHQLNPKSDYRTGLPIVVYTQIPIKRSSFDVTFIDDATGKTLQTVEKAGDVGSVSDYQTRDSIKSYEQQHYRLVSDSTNGQPIAFGDSSNQHYVVHLTHQTRETIRTSTVNQTVKYVDAQTGDELYQPNTRARTFTEIGITDLVTGQTKWVQSSPQYFDEIKSPKIDGYGEPDQPVVESREVNFGDRDSVIAIKYKRADKPAIDDRSPKTYEKNQPVKTYASLSQAVAVTAHTGQNTSTANQTIAGNQSTTAVKVQKEIKQLPQTGNSSQPQLSILGLVSGAFTVMFGLRRRKRQDN